MSSYVEELVVRMEFNVSEAKEHGIDDIWDMEDKYPNLFGVSDVNKFEVAPTEENFIDYILEYDGSSCREYGHSRKLTEEEIKEYVPKFQEIIPWKEVKGDDLRIVHFCWYNCSEAPGYFMED